MNTSGINYSEFVKYVHHHFEDRIQFDGVNEILYLQEGYNKDSPTSLGKSLFLNRLVFSGRKLGGEKYKHDQELYKGINVWIADNHKGKSTIFKIIKFALTGTDSIKKDIKPWIDEILLEFRIGENVYTCYIDRTGRDRGAVYRFNIEKFFELQQLKKLDSVHLEMEFDFKSRIQFEEKMQEFFFEQFAFYTLKYTSKNSSKDDFGLSTATLSWTTYFKSIYLESNNYEYLFFEAEKFGAQGRKIFEMILGLPLTYPINMLNIQLDRISEEIGKIKLIDKSRTETTAKRRHVLSARYKEVLGLLKDINDKGLASFSEKPLLEEYTTIQSRVNRIRKDQRALQEIYQSAKDKILLLEIEIHNFSEDKKKIEAEIFRLNKQDLNIDLYKQAESFFTNLEIKACPHCEIVVSEEKKKMEYTSHVCSLCGEVPTHQKAELGELEAKSNKIKEEVKEHEKKLGEIEKNITQNRQLLNQLEDTAAKHYYSIVNLPSIDSDNKKLNEIEEQIEAINQERTKQRDLIEKREKLMQEEAVLRFQLDEIEKEKSGRSDQELSKLQLTKDILEYSLLSLNKKRIKLNEEILKKLQDLILKEVNSFGLISITDVKIDESFNLELTQNGVVVGFGELEPGEKLRIKLAFYLSLIQLDIEHSLGRHPRFLIFDSPGSEEMVPKHLQGLSHMFKSINERFNDQLQIFVGSALREFAHITDSQRTYIKLEEEFVF